jgi:hypothetical protein
MAARRRENVGMDLEVAIRTLHREAVAGGVFAAGDPRTADPWATARAHLHPFGRGEPCTTNPCRLAALCLALFEVLQHQSEAQGLTALLDAAAKTESTWTWLRTDGHRYVEALTTLSAYGKDRHRFEHAHGLGVQAHDHDTVCVRPQQIIGVLVVLLRALEGFGDALLESPWSNELRQHGRRPRSSHLLLRAVCQHLRWGGFTYGAIATLIPDGNGPRGAAERVRKRVAMPDARSLFPRELHPDFEVEERPRRARRRVNRRRP